MSRELLIGPFTAGEIPEDQFVKFQPADTDYADHSVTAGSEKNGIPGKTGSGTTVALGATIQWADPAFRGCSTSVLRYSPCTSRSWRVTRSTGK